MMRLLCTTLYPVLYYSKQYRTHTYCDYQVKGWMMTIVMYPPSKKKQKTKGGHQQNRYIYDTSLADHVSSSLFHNTNKRSITLVYTQDYDDDRFPCIYICPFPSSFSLLCVLDDPKLTLFFSHRKIDTTYHENIIQLQNII